MSAPALRLPAPSAVVWHDVECASYDADMEAWRALADAARGPVLDLGCGTGRVALDLAARGHDVTGVDSDEELVAALRARARERGLPVAAVAMDARALALERAFALVIAPMQVAQLMGRAEGRAAMLRGVRDHLAPGGIAAIAVADPLEGLPDVAHVMPPEPDTLEVGGWRFESRPIALRAGEDGTVEIDRLREASGPDGENTGELATIALDRVDAAGLESEAVAVGLRPLARVAVPETAGYSGATIVRLEAA